MRRKQTKKMQCPGGQRQMWGQQEKSCTNSCMFRIIGCGIESVRVNSSNKNRFSEVVSSKPMIRMSEGENREEEAANKS